MDELIKEQNNLYEIAAMKLIRSFEKKHDVKFNGWVGNYFGEVAYFDNFTFDLYDIIIDLTKDAPKLLIFKWYEETIQRTIDKRQLLNYRTYITGFDYEKLDSGVS